MSKFKTKKVLAYNNLPTRLPLWPTITSWLALEHWSAAEWLYGVVGVFFLFSWIVSIVSIIKETRVDLLENDNK